MNDSKALLEFIKMAIYVTIVLLMRLITRAPSNWENSNWDINVQSKQSKWFIEINKFIGTFERLYNRPVYRYLDNQATADAAGGSCQPALHCRAGDNGLQWQWVDNGSQVVVIPFSKHLLSIDNVSWLLAVP